jgi:hypothetical protein
MDRNYLKGRYGDRGNACWPPPATTSPSSCAGSDGFGAPYPGAPLTADLPPIPLKIAVQSFFTDDYLLPERLRDL